MEYYTSIIDVRNLLDTKEESAKYKANTRDKVWVILRQGSDDRLRVIFKFSAILKHLFHRWSKREFLHAHRDL